MNSFFFFFFAYVELSFEDIREGEGRIMSYEKLKYEVYRKEYMHICL